MAVNVAVGSGMEVDVGLSVDVGSEVGTDVSVDGTGMTVAVATGAAGAQETRNSNMTKKGSKRLIFPLDVMKKIFRLLSHHPCVNPVYCQVRGIKAPVHRSGFLKTPKF